jgi:predicted phosphodiesterase
MTRYRIAALADIHGNLAALEAVLAALERYPPLDGILVAGDMICGPDQQAVLRRLVELNAVMVQGNNEQAIARMSAGTAPDFFFNSKQFSMRRWSFDHLDAAQLRLLCDLPEQRVFALPGADPIRIAHGSPRDVNELVIPPCCAEFLWKFLSNGASRAITRLEAIFEMASEPVLLFGHTHLPWKEQVDGRLAMNPGALCFPEDNFVGAQFALLTWDGSRWIPEHHAIPYDLDAFRRSNQKSGFLDTGFLAKIFLAEVLDGKDRTPAFFKLAGRLAKEAGYDHLPYFHDDIWERAGHLFAL